MSSSSGHSHSFTPRPNGRISDHALHGSASGLHGSASGVRALHGSASGLHGSPSGVRFSGLDDHSAELEQIILRMEGRLERQLLEISSLLRNSDAHRPAAGAPGAGGFAAPNSISFLPGLPNFNVPSASAFSSRVHSVAHSRRTSAITANSRRGSALNGGMESKRGSAVAGPPLCGPGLSSRRGSAAEEQPHGRRKSHFINSHQTNLFASMLSKWHPEPEPTTSKPKSPGKAGNDGFHAVQPNFKRRASHADGGEGDRDAWPVGKPTIGGSKINKPDTKRRQSRAGEGIGGRAGQFDMMPATSTLASSHAWPT